MNPSQIVDLVRASDAFGQFTHTHPDAYLVHVFGMTEGIGSVGSSASVSGDDEERGLLTGMQVGFYLPGIDRVVTFAISDRDRCVSASEPAEVFKKTRDPVPLLLLDDVQVSLDDALSIARKAQAEHYSAHRMSKLIVLLQQSQDDPAAPSPPSSVSSSPARRPVYNLTAITSTFNTIVLRIDAANGALLQHQLLTLRDLTSQA